MSIGTELPGPCTMWLKDFGAHECLKRAKNAVSFKMHLDMYKVMM